MEEQNHYKIVDQALEHPVKYTVMLTKEIFSLNKNLFWSIAAAVILLSFLAKIPILGMVASVASGILMFLLFFFVGKCFYRSGSMDDFVESIRSMTLNDLAKDYWKPSLGAYAGWGVLLLAVLMVIGVMIGISGYSYRLSAALQTNNPQEILALWPAIILPLILIALLLYLMPLVFANTLKTDSFNAAFKAVFGIFGKDLLRRAFTLKYFTYMGILGLLLILLSIAFVLLFELYIMLFGTMPFMIIVGVLLLMVAVVVVQILVNIFYAISSVIADRMTQR